MKLIFLTALCLCAIGGLSAQTITGTVLDADKETVIGAYILLKNSPRHTHTNELGQFRLDGVAIGDTLQVLYLGYETLEQVIVSTEPLTIRLQEAAFDLGEIVVGQEAGTTNLITAIDLWVRPVTSAQELMTVVPGLFVGQHAGGGKAEQIFLRGFDVDHGTDVSVSVDGMPVNMVSHAHGQGYADLHFVIPETVESIDFGKGPYYAERGNFTTAGYLELSTKEKLDNSLARLEIGDFGTVRGVALLDLVSTERHNVYLAGEHLLSNGPFDSPQNFRRTNAMLKYSGQPSDRDQLSFTASHFTSTWEASGQIPQRAVDSGLIGRFGAIDDTEGGHTSRTNLLFRFDRAVDSRTYVKNTAYFSRYDFELFSNFTFFLENPERGDQIRQFEDRSLFGAQTELSRTVQLGNSLSALVQGGAGFRYDDIDDNTLAQTANRRELLDYLALGNVDETNLFAFAEAEFEFGKLLVETGLRYDHFLFNYVDALQTTYEKQSDRRGTASPKLNLLYQLNPGTRLYAKSGIGFHANDTRVVVREPRRRVLPAAYGADLGATFKPARRLLVDVALWYLYLQQEFVYVGDAGIVEPSGRTQRTGLDVGLRWQPFDNWLLRSDVNLARPRSLDEPEGADRIPLAPTLTAAGGLSYRTDRFDAALNYRYLADRPANEDNSIVAEGYFITDLVLNYRVRSFNFGVVVQNLFNQSWNETQFATESRLDFETAPVEEIHFTPGAPVFVRGVVGWRF